MLVYMCEESFPSLLLQFGFVHKVHSGDRQSTHPQEMLKEHTQAKPDSEEGLCYFPNATFLRAFSQWQK